MSTARVLVLLATYNGRRFLPEQVHSILTQRDVAVRLVALDDGSTDGTLEWLAEQAATDDRLTVLESDGPSGGSAKNFYRLMERVELGDSEFIAFADQDDVWRDGKLARHAHLIRTTGLDGVSSNIVSFDERGRRTLITKSYPQRELDYLVDSPGPGSTYLITPRLLDLARLTLASEPEAREVEFHDSLLYALARAAGYRWLIDAEPSVDYRQHGSNVIGSNVGASSAVRRLRLIRDKWHRAHVTRVTRSALAASTVDTRPGLQRMLALLTDPRIRARLPLARALGSQRRRPRDRAVLSALIALGIW
jgi:rhamnosyltransferase